MVPWFSNLGIIDTYCSLSSIWRKRSGLNPFLMSVFAVATAVGAAPAMAADPPAKVLAEFGLTGTWASACDQPAGPRNPKVTYEPRPEGQVDGVGDLGPDGSTRATALEAFIDQDHRLHMTTYATFDHLPKAMRESLEKSGLRPNLTTKSIQAMSGDHSLITEDSIVELDGSAAHMVSGGYLINQATQAPGPKMPARFKCSDAGR